MKPFTRLTGFAAVLRESDIDTDIIFPARFLLLLDKTGLGTKLFYERRNQPGSDGKPFILNRPPFDKARILVAGANFGSGSSREQAVWALADFGIHCLIAPSFGEIFYANCFKNGVLPIVLDRTAHLAVMEAAENGQQLTIDLEGGQIGFAEDSIIPFDLDIYKRDALLSGLDEIGSILKDDIDDIRAFEARQREQAPWLHLDAGKRSYFANVGQETAID